MLLDSQQNDQSNSPGRSSTMRAGHDVTAVKTTRYGTSYTVEGPLRSPDGRDPNVRTIWMLRSGETVPRLVTAIPLKGRTS